MPPLAKHCGVLTHVPLMRDLSRNCLEGISDPCQSGSPHSPNPLLDGILTSRWSMHLIVGYCKPVQRRIHVSCSAYGVRVVTSFLCSCQLASQALSNSFLLTLDGLG